MGTTLPPPPAWVDSVLGVCPHVVELGGRGQGILTPLLSSSSQLLQSIASVSKGLAHGGAPVWHIPGEQDREPLAEHGGERVYSGPQPASAAVSEN